MMFSPGGEIIMAQFAIMRTRKLKSGAAMRGLERHNERLREVPGADPDRARDNQIIVGQDEQLNDAFARLTEGQKVRSNAVRAVEVMMTFSPEAPPKDLQAWVRDNRRWLEQEFGKENLVKLYLHMDEATPHLHAVVIPIDPKGKLNCRHFLGGADKLSALQDRYAVAMKPHNLERGNKGNKARHQSVKKFYSLIQTPTIEQLPPPKPLEGAKAYRDRLAPVVEKLNANFAQAKIIGEKLRQKERASRIQKAKAKSADRPKESIGKKILKAKNQERG
jgi:hypothetical protein